MDLVDDPQADLTGPTMPMQPTLMSAAWSAVTITPGFCRP